jgi:glyceraldehyde-3-phosphate dehydrogenase/erythrose-4-phosphate dehydrogenase
MKKVFVNGYGSIGSRIVSFLKDDPEIQVIGIGKYSPLKKRWTISPNLKLLEHWNLH